MTLVPVYGHNSYWKYDPERTIVSDCGTMHAIFVGGGKKPKIFRIRLVQPDDYTKQIGYITFLLNRHNIRFGYQDGCNRGHVKNLTETGADLAQRLFTLAKAFKS